MANIITLTRLLLLLPLVAMIYLASPSWQLATVPLLAVIIGMDGLDGYVARKRREVSVFGSIFDIAVDRVIEYVLWAVLGHVGLVPMWVALVFIVRGTFVDSIRYAAIAERATDRNLAARALQAQVRCLYSTQRHLHREGFFDQ
jgi:CDP-diacylglycerol--glycerol-3-phosphate 3-phosphatidyltransferase